MKKGIVLLLIFTMIIGSFAGINRPVAAAAAATVPYTIYPNPHDVNYHDKQFEVSETINIVYESKVDSYTKKRVEEVLAVKNIKFTESSGIVEDKTNFLVGVNGSNEYVDNYFESKKLRDATILAKLDANIISIDNNVIAVLGKDVDSAFYGVTTVKHIFKQMNGRTIEALTIKDYADVKGRGFIEGYYGEPWSNEDRAELMTFGGEFKMNSYIYAPKDDPKHNSKWRELYTEDELLKISKLAEAGNASKTRFVYTLHPFMSNAIRFNTEENYQADLTIIKAKFTQLLNAGVRKFGILADDAGVPAQGAQTYVKLMIDLSNWLVEQQSTYDGLVTDMIFCPNDYMGWGDSAQIQTLKQLPKSVSIVMTGGKVWGEVSNNFTQQFTNNAGRGPYLWINWPCTDNSKKHLIMGGNETFLQPNVDPANIEGIVLNPMQQSEASKSAIFANADYAWNIWDNTDQAKQNWSDSFAYMDHLNINETPASNALRELSKHMINQNMDSRVAVLQESVELAPKLNEFKALLGKGKITDKAQALITEFEVIRDAAITYKANPGNPRTRDQIVYWLDSAVDTADAAIFLLKAEIAHESGNSSSVWENYSQGQAAYDASLKHPFRYIDHYEYAEVGVQHLVPFIKTLLNDVSIKVQSSVNPDSNVARVITNRTDTPTGNIDNILDNTVGTEVIYKNPNTIMTGTYIGVRYEKSLTFNTVRFELGHASNNADTFGASKAQYTIDGVNWIDIEGTQYGNINKIVLENLNLKARGIRLIATNDRTNTWFGIKDIVVNETKVVNETLQYTLMVPSHFTVYQGTGANLFDGNDSTFIWYNPSGTIKDTSVVGDYIGVDLKKEIDLGKVYFAVGRDNGDKWTEYQLEYSTDNVNYTLYKKYTGKASGLDKVEEDLTGIKARYVRLKNLKNVNVWIKFSEIRVEVAKLSSEYTYTNNDNYKNIASQHTLENTSLAVTTNITLKPQQYVGVKLERIKELDHVTVSTTSDKLTLQASANEVEWNTPIEGAIVKYVRLLNNTDEDITFNLNEFSVSSKEIYGPSFVGTDMGISAAYGADDSRNAGTLLAPFDKKFGTKAIFTDFQRKGQYITYSVGEPRIFNSLRVYNEENNINYIRDAKVQLSMDNKTWTDVITLGDGLDNLAGGKPNYADMIADGYTHDSANPGNYYYGNDNIGGIEAKYIRIVYTADFLARFAHINEFVINGGEYVETENNPTFVVDPIEEEGFGPGRLIDGNLTTAFKPNMTNRTDGSLTYRLSDKTDVAVITIVQGSNAISNATVSGRVGTDQWVDLGILDRSLTTIYNSTYDHIFEIKLSWGNVQPLIYEMNISTNKELIPAEADKIALLEAITEAEKKVQADYTVESWNIFSQALTVAQAMNKKQYATQVEVDSAVSALIEAQSKLVEVASDSKEITAFSFMDLSPAVTGTINGSNINLTVPYGTDVSALIATFTSTGTLIQVDGVDQVSGTTANNFISQVAYTVTAQDGTTQIYTVTVTVAPSNEKEITSFSFAGLSPEVIGTINGSNIDLIVPYGTDVSTLIATFTSTGSSIQVNGTDQVSGTTANDFTTPVTYTVTAQDGTTQFYTVKVTVVTSNSKEILAFSFNELSPAVIGKINGSNIDLTVPHGTDVSALIATFTSTGSLVEVAGTTQVSGTTANDFTIPVTYTITAQDGTTQTYSVSVIVAASSSKEITEFSFMGLSPEVTGTINGTNIALTVPNGTDLSELIATFTSTGTTVEVDGITQVSGTTANDFTTPVTYIVTAQDGTTQTYIVTVAVTVAPSSEKAITAFSFKGLSPEVTGTINGTNIALTVPYGTDVRALIATFSCTGTSVQVDGTEQLSGITANNFTLPVTYTVTAKDGTTQTYTVTVKVAAGSTNNVDPEPVKKNDGKLTLLIGGTGTANLHDEIKVNVPVGSISQPLQLTIEKILNPSNLINDNDVLISPVFEIVKNFSDEFIKPITVTVKFDPSKLGDNQKPSIAYYDEEKKTWIALGGTVSGDEITVEVSDVATLAVFGVNEPVVPSVELADIQGHWAEEAINKAIVQGIVNGYPDGSFRPEASITRQEFIVMLVHALKLEGDQSTLLFNDNTKISDWAKDEISLAVQAGIVNGYADGTFRPNAQISRVEMSALLEAAMRIVYGMNVETENELTFTDNENIPAWAKEAVAVVASNGLMTGRGDNNFVPNEATTRAEAITVIMRLLELEK
ncbi:MAG: beta-N-acetylglucosaminidase domain-containing protein [Candidatus Pristimantibacillus lignocellulolyticus]|uniref:Beta-N-acetylglucosaminidase domain-containing protein n=1 Tax=Candidatus Pristimantibacillus lignocellulolyticus TaxID=2994561 RepID=A0A9J6ZJW5_9BACL|nr:MAG: beta-N-acetylglucosaminidase domain-containing protein [Candidatus Pristimantibacillus lignocellulolyticus]